MTLIVTRVCPTPRRHPSGITGVLANHRRHEVRDDSLTQFKHFRIASEADGSVSMAFGSQGELLGSLEGVAPGTVKCVLNSMRERANRQQGASCCN